MATRKNARHVYTAEEEQELLDAVNDPNAPSLKQIIKDFSKQWKIKPGTLNSKIARLRKNGPMVKPTATGPSSRQQDPGTIGGANCIRVPIKSFTIQQRGDKIELVMMLN
jgi:hypothetical protein